MHASDHHLLSIVPQAVKNIDVKEKMSLRFLTA